MNETIEDAPVKTRAPVSTDDGDHDLFAHYVPKAQLEAAIFDGTSCLALCGKTWLPTKDATRYPVCPECKDVFENVLTDD